MCVLTGVWRVHRGRLPPGEEQQLVLAVDDGKRDASPHAGAAPARRVWRQSTSRERQRLPGPVL